MHRSLFALAAVGVLSLVPAGAALAQQSGFGLKGGATYSDLRGDLPPDAGLGPRQFDPGIGWAAGAFLAFEVSHNVVVQPEAYYVRRVAELDFDTLGVKTVLEVDYVEVPVLLKFTGGDVYSRVRPSLFFGASLAYLLEATSEAESAGRTVAVDVSDDLEEIDIGAVVGVGLDFAGGIQLDARYTYGITEVFNDAPDPAELKWGIVSVMLGYRF